MSPHQEHDDAATKEISAAAKVLAKYGLGVFWPHIHSETGDMSPLPKDVVAFEKDLVVSFRPLADVPASAIHVAWRWTEERLEICGLCCANHSPPPPPPPPPPPIR